MKIVIYLHVLFFTHCLGDQPSELTIGVIFPSNLSVLKDVFHLALEDINSNQKLLPDIKLVPLIKIADEPYDAIRGACNLASQGIVSLIGPLNTRLTQVTKVICEKLGLPQISILASDPMLSWLPNSAQSSCTSLKMSPPDTYQNQALASIIQYYEWSSFALLTEESQYGLHGIMELQRLAVKNDWTILSFQRFQYDSKDRVMNLTFHLKEIKESNVRVVVLHCAAKYSKQILRQADKLGMIRNGWAWLVTDSITTHGPRILAESDGYVSSSLFGLLGAALATPDSILLTNLLHRLDDEHNGKKYIYKQTIARIYDALLSVAYGLHNILYVKNIPFEDHYFGKGIPCTSREIQSWKWGIQLFNSISVINNVTGCLGSLKFTDHGYHHLVNYDIVNLQAEGFIKVGQWVQQTNQLNIASNVIFPGQATEAPKISYCSLHNKTIKIGVIKDMPFLMDNNNYQPEDPSSLKYQGFLMDLLLKLQEMHKFRYTIQEVLEYGYKNVTTKKWNGLVHLLLEKKIDLAMAAFTISWERQEVIAFTKPFYDLGLTILMPKHNAATERRYFVFLSPFEPIVWIIILVSMLLASASIVICNTVAQGLQNKETKDWKLSLLNAIWWGFSSLVSPGTSIKQMNTLPSKIVMGSWWITTFVLAASYTAKLAAVMTIEQMNKGIDSLEELVSSEAIKFGTLGSSHTRNFFQNSQYHVHKNAYHFMNKHDTFVESSEEGIKKVRASYSLPEGHKDRYALIYDSPILEYAATQQPCNVKTVGRLFGLQNYGFGLRKDSPYEKQLSVSILQLREDGYMDLLQQKWFTTACSEKGTQPREHLSLNLWNVIGIFGVLLCGIGIALVITTIRWFRETLKEKKKLQDNMFQVCLISDHEISNDS